MLFPELKFVHYANTNYFLIYESFERFMPFDIPYDKLPSFGGPGSWWDKIVPDTVRKVWAACAFLLHDYPYTIGLRTPFLWLLANLIMFWNLFVVVFANRRHTSRASAKFTMLVILMYWIAVMTKNGWRCFTPTEVNDPMDSEDFRKMMDRLNTRRIELGIPTVRY